MHAEFWHFWQVSKPPLHTGSVVTNLYGCHKVSPGAVFWHYHTNLSYITRLVSPGWMRDGPVKRKHEKKGRGQLHVERNPMKPSNYLKIWNNCTRWEIVGIYFINIIWINVCYHFHFRKFQSYLVLYLAMIKIKLSLFLQTFYPCGLSCENSPAVKRWTQFSLGNNGNILASDCLARIRPPWGMDSVFSW